MYISQELALVQGMTDQQKMIFLTRFAGLRKDVTTGVLFALFLGGFGAHRFYLKQTGLGVLYLLFFWTWVPAIIALIECFMMSERVRTYNSEQAEQLALHVRAVFPAVSLPPPLGSQASISL